jgi:hypothetical protein
MRSLNARRTSWTDGMSDLFHRMMDSSDPVILEHTNKRKTKKENRKNLFRRLFKIYSSPQMVENLTLTVVIQMIQVIQMIDKKFLQLKFLGEVSKYHRTTKECL